MECCTIKIKFLYKNKNYNPLHVLYDHNLCNEVDRRIRSLFIKKGKLYNLIIGIQRTFSI